MDGKYYVVLCRICKRHNTIKLTNQQYLKKKVRCKICGNKGEVHESLPNEFQPEKFKTSKPGAYKSTSAKSNFRRTKTAQSMATKGTRNEYARVKHRLAKQKTREKGACLGCGKTIPYFRLQAMPGTNLCVKCAQK